MRRSLPLGLSKVLLQHSRFLLAWELRMSLAQSTDTQLDSESHVAELPIHQSNIYQCLCYGDRKSDKP